MTDPMLSSGNLCARCKRRPASQKIEIAIGHYDHSHESLMGDWTSYYSGTKVEVSVCKRCYRLYHLKSDLLKGVAILLALIGIAYVPWAYVTYGSIVGAMIIGFFVSLGIGVLVYIPYRIVFGPVLRTISDPLRYLENDPRYLARRLRSNAIKLFYVDRHGNVET